MQIQSPVKKISNSSIQFKQLINNLRNKSKGNKQSINKNPQQVSVQGNKSLNQIGKDSANSSSVVSKFCSEVISTVDQDINLQLKPKGSVGGRDIHHLKNLIKEQKNKFHQEFNNLIKSNQQKKLQKQQQQIQINKKQQSQNNIQNSEINQKMLQKVIPNFQSIHQTHFLQPNQQQSAEPIIRNTNIAKFGFSQKKINYANCNLRKIKDIQQSMVEQYYRQNKCLDEKSQPHQINLFFSQLCNFCKIYIACPFIRKFKNCIYYGQQSLLNEKHQGFLYYFDQKFYYGEFLNKNKHGRGVQIYLNQNYIYKGIFQHGAKTGKFFVQKQHESYIGFLQNGQYCGEGRLNTKDYTYQGFFQNGKKHGYGEQIHPKSGLKFIGYFREGFFKNSKKQKQLYKSKPEFSSTHKVLRGKSNSHQSHNLAFKNIVKNRQISPYLRNCKYNTNNNSHQNHLYSSDSNKSTTEDKFFQKNQFIQKKEFENRTKEFFNKTKLNAYLPQMKKFQIASTCPVQEFDFSFDASSRQNSELNTLNSQKSKKNYGYNKKRSKFHQISNMNKDHCQPIIEDNEPIEAVQTEQPLPLPSFRITKGHQIQ